MLMSTDSFCYNHTVKWIIKLTILQVTAIQSKNICALQINFKDPQNLNAFSSAMNFCSVSYYKSQIWERKTSFHR